MTTRNKIIYVLEIITFILIFICIINSKCVVHAADGFPITPVYNVDVLSPTEIIQWVNENTNFNEVSTTQYLIILEGVNDYYYWFDVYCTPLPLTNGSFLGDPLSITNYDYPIYISQGTYTQSYEIRYDRSDGSMREYARTDNYIKSADRVLFCSERNVYFQSTEEIAIQYLTQGGSDVVGEIGTIVKPPFYEDENTPTIPDNETLSDNSLLKKIANGIFDVGNKVKNGFNNMYDNIKDFTQPYYEEFLKLYNSIRDGIDYIKQPLDLDAIKTKINSLSIMQDITTINDYVTSIKNMFNNATPKTDSNAKFVIDFTPVEMFHTGQVVVDFSFYSSIRTICNAFILMSVIVSFILYILKSLPDIIRGASADDK